MRSEGGHLWANVGDNKKFVQTAFCMGCNLLLQI